MLFLLKSLNWYYIIKIKGKYQVEAEKNDIGGNNYGDYKYSVQKGVRRL